MADKKPSPSGRARRVRPPAAPPVTPAAPTVVPLPARASAGPSAVAGPARDDAPADLAEHGRNLWEAVTGDYELERHELELLEQAARTSDLLEALRVALEDGALLTGEGKIRPEIVEQRQQRIVYARLLAALRVPLGAEQDDTGRGPARLQRRSGARGVYRPRGGRS